VVSVRRFWYSSNMKPSPDLSPASDSLRNAALNGLLCLFGAACVPAGTPEVTCDTSIDPDDAEITSSTVDPNMTLELFTLECNALGGTVEEHSHCGGQNSCQGMSYYVGTETLTVHSCQGLNSCTGYSCVVCD